MLNAISNILYKFDDMKPLTLMLDIILEAELCYCQPKHMDDNDYLKAFTMLLKVYEQFSGILVYNKIFAKEVNKEVDEAVETVKART